MVVVICIWKMETHIKAYFKMDIFMGKGFIHIKVKFTLMVVMIKGSDCKDFLSIQILVQEYPGKMVMEFFRGPHL
jgi:hypothetical protein